MTLKWQFTYPLTSTILGLPPGSDTISAMTTSFNYGYCGAVASITGLQTGLAIHIVLADVRSGTLFFCSMTAFEVLEQVGVAYLVWLGTQQWRAASAVGLKSLASAQSRRHLPQHAVFVNLTNPKNVVFLTALFPRFTMPQQLQLTQCIVLGVTTIMVGIIVMIGYATLAQRITLWIRGPRQTKALSKILGSLLMLVGALLASVRHT